MENTAIELSQKGKKAFEEGDFENAIHFFSEAAKTYMTPPQQPRIKKRNF